MVKRSNIRSTAQSTALLMALIALSVGVAGCETDAQSGSLIGAGIGALAGQAIGNDTTGTLIGTAVGGVTGYAVGNERDKSKAKKQRQAENRYDPRAARRSNDRYDDGATTSQRAPSSHNPLAGTRWRVVSLVWPDAPQFDDLQVQFKRDGSLVATLTDADGQLDTHRERYRIVANALIVNVYDDIINATFSLDHDELIIVAPSGRAVLRKMY